MVCDPVVTLAGVYGLYFFARVVIADVYGHLLAPSTATADAMAHVMYGT
jgi:hypothetical protein